MNNISIAVQGGAGEDSEFIKSHQSGYKKGLEDAVNTGYKILKGGGSALDAVENAVRSLEDNPLFNSGRGSALNNKGEVEMDASIMDGKKNNAGAVSMVRNVKNPVTLARFIMENTSHVFLSGAGALEIAKEEDLALEGDSYFITEHQVEEFIKDRKQDDYNAILKKRIHGTVGAVALDKAGNLAAATSTGGTPNCLDGRIGDSCVIGAGCYANNSSCAVSGTGDGELLIINVIAYSIAFYMELKNCSLQDACDYVIHQRNMDVEGDIGVIAVDTRGNLGVCFNSERMHRAWKNNEEKITVKIYK
ncbi:isoaspartyl peptidase/L-asparaginase [Salegentibacter sp. JZCK2]|uniref:isoaspartyl peptidase/L-asparaginase family protein n=1 Tax=Salegentibacter tibetensis TaxID=2873600 RepID=UPI001CCDCE02|nr:isoaspartyl peptidase/L-asparaginase [Salegentibacter tibetensis]MBZ9728064.1 isoaspartyl peptidase/L-asparaginase [Salegentibacter tibetensis]